MAPEAAVRRAAKAVARHLSEPVASILMPRGRRARRARQMTAYLAVTVYNQPIRSVSRVLGLDHAGVIKALARVEDGRDDDGFDRMILHIEGALQ